MKKIISMILCCTMIIGMCSCGSDDTQDGIQITVCYVNSGETKVESHKNYLYTGDLESQVEEVKEYLYEIPAKFEYKAPFAMGFEVNSCKVEDGRVILDVDSKYYELQPTTEVLVRAAIVKSFTAIEGIDYVEITVNGGSLYDSAGQQVGWMNSEQFIANDGSEINIYEKTKVKLYFANSTGDKLIGAYREKYYSTNTPMDKFIVDELIAGPSGKIPELYASINPATKVLSVTTKDGICYVNLDSAFLNSVDNVSIDVAIYSIVNSLVELGSVNKVQILINGEVPGVFTNTVYERNLDFVTSE